MLKPNAQGSAKALPWFLFAAGGTVTAFVLPVMLLVTNLGFFPSAMSYETMSEFLSWWIVKLALFGILVLGLWHAAHRLRVCAHDFGLRADEVVAWVVYGGAALGSVAALIALLMI
jgi:fumarate reductase subunit D